MWYFILALPLVFIGAYTRTYNLGDLGECFWIDYVSWGAACFPNATFVPALVAYGSMVAGWVLIFLGWRAIRRPRATSP